MSSTQYTTLAAVKAAMRIPDTIDDDLIVSVIEGACRRIDEECGRVFYADSTATARVFAANGNRLLLVDDISSTTGLVVRIDSNVDGTFETTFTSSQYQLEPLNSLSRNKPVEMIRAVDSNWPTSSTGRALVEITARWGWPAVPAPVAEAARLTVLRLFNRFNSPLGIAGFGDLGAVMVRNLDPDVRDMLHAFHKVGIA